MTPAVLIMTPLTAAAWGYALRERIAERLRHHYVQALGRLGTPPVRARRVGGAPTLSEIGPRLAALLSAAIVGRASLPLRLAFGALVGGLALPLGGNAVVALVVGALAVSLPRTIAQYRAERWLRSVDFQLPSFVQAVRTAVLTDGGLPAATQIVAAETLPPLGTLLRSAVADARLGGQRIVTGVDGEEHEHRATLGQILWAQAALYRVRYLQRFAHVLMQAERGTSDDALDEALGDLDRELMEDHQLKRKRDLAAGQTTALVQGGVAVMGLLYIVDYAAGAGHILQHTTFGLVATAAAALFSLAALALSGWATRRLAPGRAGARNHKKGGARR